MIYGIIAIFSLNYFWDLAKLSYYKPYNEFSNYYSDLGYNIPENQRSRHLMQLGSLISFLFMSLESLFNSEELLIKTLIYCLGFSLAQIGIFNYDKEHSFFSLLHGVGFVNILIFLIILFIYYNPMISICLLILTIINFLIILINRIRKLNYISFRKIECAYQKGLIFIVMIVGFYLFFLFR
jgi:hypothetical protein